MNLCGYLSSKAAIPEAIHSQMMKYFRQYVAIGGMPEAVQKYIDTKDFREVDRIQRNLLQGYQYDIAHYATAEEKVKAEKCYLSLAKQLLDKENHKFQYKEVEHGGRAQKYFSSIEWLLRADMLYLCKLVTDIRFDLDDYARDDFFRAYTTDLSLLMAMKDFSLKQHIIENTLAGNSKGGIFECVVADALHKKGYQLYFYKNETTKKEIDVIIQKDGKVVPIEVKSGNTRANSLKSIMKNNKDISYGYKFIDGNIGTSEEGIITLPLYMIAFFDKVSE
jgi:predicted AAA+ superfamily ATPase